MGVYDSIVFSCQNCNGTVEFQSKVGDCLMKTFLPDKVPFDIADDIINDTSVCTACGEEYGVEVSVNRYVAMKLKKDPAP